MGSLELIRELFGSHTLEVDLLKGDLRIWTVGSSPRRQPHHGRGQQDPSYFRRGPRPNEIFYVFELTDASRLRSEFVLAYQMLQKR